VAALYLADQLVWWRQQPGASAEALFPGGAVVIDQSLGDVRKIALADANNDRLTGVCWVCAVRTLVRISAECGGGLHQWWLAWGQPSFHVLCCADIFMASSVAGTVVLYVNRPNAPGTFSRVVIAQVRCTPPLLRPPVFVWP
jgi:hypothetical protein